MVSVKFILLVIAFVLFLLDAFMTQAKVRLTPLGLAAATLAFLVH